MEQHVESRLERMIEEYHERRHRNLTAADIEAIKEAIGMHTCRFQTIDPKELSEAWPVLRDFATSVTQAKAVTLKAIAAGLAVFFLGLLGRGIWHWFTELHNRIGTIVTK